MDVETGAGGGILEATVEEGMAEGKVGSDCRLLSA